MESRRVGLGYLRRDAVRRRAPDPRVPRTGPARGSRRRWPRADQSLHGADRNPVPGAGRPAGTRPVVAGLVRRSPTSPRTANGCCSASSAKGLAPKAPFISGRPTARRPFGLERAADWHFFGRQVGVDDVAFASGAAPDPVGVGESRSVKLPDGFDRFQSGQWLPDGRLLIMAGARSRPEGVRSADWWSASCHLAEGLPAPAGDLGRWPAGSGLDQSEDDHPQCGWRGRAAGVGDRAGGDTVAWSRDGQSVLVTTSNRDMTTTVHRVNLKTGVRMVWKILAPADSAGLVRIFAFTSAETKRPTPTRTSVGSVSYTWSKACASRVARLQWPHQTASRRVTSASRGPGRRDSRPRSSTARRRTRLPRRGRASRCPSARRSWRRPCRRT